MLGLPPVPCGEARQRRRRRLLQPRRLSAHQSSPARHIQRAHSTCSIDQSRQTRLYRRQIALFRPGILCGEPRHPNPMRHDSNTLWRGVRRQVQQHRLDGRCVPRSTSSTRGRLCPADLEHAYLRPNSFQYQILIILNCSVNASPSDTFPKTHTGQSSILCVEALPAKPPPAQR